MPCKPTPVHGRPTGSFCADGVVGSDEDTCILLPEWSIRCGPRKTIYFDPKTVRACEEEDAAEARQHAAAPPEADDAKLHPRCGV